MPFTREQAARIALAHLLQAASEDTPSLTRDPRHSRPPAIDRVCSIEELEWRPPLVYALQDRLGDCWVAYVAQPTIDLRSSEIVLVSRESGEVVYHGSAYDEG